MKKGVKFILLSAVIFIHAKSPAQRLAPFTSLTGNRGYPAITQPVPYEKVQSRFEFIDSTCTYLKQKKTGWTYTAWFEIKDSLQELGIRIISPLPDLMSPAKGDVTTPAFDAKPAKDNSGFKPEIYLLKAVAKSDDMNFIELKDMTPVSQRNWKAPSFRITDKGDGTKLSPGIYQIVIFTQDRAKPQGAFALQFGSIPRIQIPVFVHSPTLLK